MLYRKENETGKKLKKKNKKNRAEAWTEMLETMFVSGFTHFRTGISGKCDVLSSESINSHQQSQVLQLQLCRRDK